MSFVFKPKKQYKFSVTKKEDYKIYYPPKLSLAQKNFDVIKPVHPFNRFSRSKIADTGVDPQQAFLHFIQNDPTLPYSREMPSVYDEYKKLPKSPSEKWTIGNTCKCNNEKFLAIKDPYKDYFFEKKNDEKIKAYQKNFLPTDHISLGRPKLSESVDNYFSFLKMKSVSNINNDSESYWVPKINNRLTVANQSSVAYNIINNADQKSNVSNNVNMNDKFINNKKKGIAEFSDYLNSHNYNPNLKYVSQYEQNKNRFQRYKGVFSELYDSCSRNGNIYLPFRGRINNSNSDKNIKFDKFERSKSTLGKR